MFLPLVGGTVRYDPANKAYIMNHTNLNDGYSAITTIPVQKEGLFYKKYTIVYFVFEKEFPCGAYPPDGQVTFFDIKVEYDNQPVEPKWTTDYVDDVCNNRAHILNESSIRITWDTTQEAVAADPLSYMS